MACSPDAWPPVPNSNSAPTADRRGRVGTTSDYQSAGSRHVARFWRQSFACRSPTFPPNFNIFAHRRQQRRGRGDDESHLLPRVHHRTDGSRRSTPTNTSPASSRPGPPRWVTYTINPEVWSDSGPRSIKWTSPKPDSCDQRRRQGIRDRFSSGAERMSVTEGRRPAGRVIVRRRTRVARYVRAGNGMLLPASMTATRGIQ